jgi:hypothetical protein
MSDTRLGVFGLDLQPLLTITQFVIPAGAGATFAVSNNIATITTNAAHGLVLNPAAGVPPNYFVQFGGSTSALTGTGILVGNTFRILSIPSTTTFTIYTTVIAATVTSMTVLPVFCAPFIAGLNTSYAGGPTQTITAVVTPFPRPQFYAAAVNLSLGANLAAQWNTDGTFIPLDGSTGPTPATAPVFKTVAAASTNGQVWMPPTSHILIANGTTATSFAQVVQ